MDTMAAVAAGGDGGLLPRLVAGSSARGASPNVAKRAIGWATPREPAAPLPGGPQPKDEPPTTDSEALAALLTPRATAPTVAVSAGEEESGPPVDSALETLELLVWESDAANEGARRRMALLDDLQRQRAAEERQREQARLASVEHMADTIRLLRDELERARSGQQLSISGGEGGGAVLPPVVASRLLRGDKRRRHDREPGQQHSEEDDERDDERACGRRALLSPRLHDSPLLRRHKTLMAGDNHPSSPRTDALAKRAEQRLAARLTAGQPSSSLTSPLLAPPSSLMTASSFELSVMAPTPLQSLDAISSREEKLRALLLERDHWQREYAQMRDKVVEEKTRQVTLFRRLDDARRDHLAQIGALEAALRGANTEVELLRAQLAQARAAAGQLQQRADDLARRAWEEKQTLVCSIAETRHKFKEWKEGEAATLKAARDQAVHNLKTEYELKIARHHEEKQKLRDKVKDLEVSLRLLQRDRHMSAVELSQRKSTILGKDAPAPSFSALMSGATAEAELIEAQSRIKELEALLEYAKEYQKRQENVIQVSEAAITRLMQERDVVALENLSFEPAAAMLPSLRGTAVATANGMYSDPSSGSSEYAGYALRKPSRPRRSSFIGQQSKTSSSSSLAAVLAPSMASGGAESMPSRHPSSPSVVVPSAAALAALKPPESPGNDPEKEILRRQSVVLSAELDKYRQLVVHSMDEIRSLKDQRRRSHQSLVATANGALGVTTIKEQYLMSELLKAQGELGELKRRLTVKKRSGSGKEHAERKNSSFFDENDESGGSDNDSSSSSSSNNSSSSSSDDSGSDDEQPSENKDSESPSAASDSGTGQEHQAETDTSPATAAVATTESSDQTSPSDESTASHEATRPIPAAPAASGDPLAEVLAVGAVAVLQKQGKAFLARRAFIKKKLAIEKIKARYRGYLVRKNLEMLGCELTPPQLPRAGGRALSNAVSEAAQYKMRVVAPHHEAVCDCQGHVFKVVIRVSKDPSLVQMQMLPSTQNASQRHLLDLSAAPEESHAVSFSRTATRVAYFHLFEVIAALPYEEETLILEHTSEREIAAVVASTLRVVRVSGEYKFLIDRRSCRQGESSNGSPAAGYGFAAAIPPSGTLLVELPVVPTQPSAARRSTAGAKAGEDEEEDEDAAPEESRDLDCLIRDARLPPEEDALVPTPTADELPLGGPSASTSAITKGGGEFLTSRQMRRLSMSSLGVILER